MSCAKSVILLTNIFFLPQYVELIIISGLVQDITSRFLRIFLTNPHVKSCELIKIRGNTSNRRPQKTSRISRYLNIKCSKIRPAKVRLSGEVY